MKNVKTEFTKRTIGIESLTPQEEAYWKNRNIEFRPILEYKPLSKEEEERLNTEYYTNNNRVGFEKLYYAVRKPNGKTAKKKLMYSPTIRQVQAWLAKQTSAQDYKPVEKPKDTKPIIVSKVNDLVQMDYLVMTQDLRYNGHKHVLNCIDVLSKRAHSRTIRLGAGHDPTAAQTLVLATDIFEEIKKREGAYPKRLQTDNGAHFLAEFERAFQTGGSLEQIRYTSGLRYRASSQSVVERFNKTLRDMMRRMVISGQPNWPAALPQLLANYNSNKHSVLRMAPNEAKDDNLKEAKERIKKRAVAKNHNSLVLEEGDKVRLVNFKKQKSPQYKDEPNWWPEIYEIYHVIRPKDPTHPLRYNLEPNPPTTIVGNRPGYRGPNARGRRQFSVYELQIVGRKGEAGYEALKVATSIDVANKIAEEEMEEMKQKEAEEKAKQKQGGKQAASKPKKLDKPASEPAKRTLRDRKKTPQDLVGKAIEVKWDASGPLTEDHVKAKGDKGTFYKALVSSYNADTGLHKVQYVSDRVIAEHNLAHPRKPQYISTGFWKLSSR
jgi:hypothetical protein